MKDEQPGRLVKMANQIAANLQGAGDDQAVAHETVAHLRKFWTPAMRDRLAQYARQGGEGLSPAASLAAKSL